MFDRQVKKVLLFVLAVVPASNLTLAETVVSSDVDYVADAVYTDDRDRLDIYMPENADGVPVIVYFHGGALRAGEKRDGEGVASRINAKGIGFVSANYRLTPTVMHPAHVQDAAAATAWVLQNIEDYGGDSDNVYVAGHSAGAYLAALLLLDSTHIAAHGIDLGSIRGAIPISPFLYVEETAAERPKDVWGENPTEWLSASVTPHIRNDQGRFLLIYADGDAEWRRHQIDRFGEAMKMAGNNDIEVIEVPNRNHGSIISEINAADDKIGDLVAEFIVGN